jgi:hypothetical protein
MASELRRRLHAVDPDLNIVPGGMHRGSKQAEDNWAAAAGVTCSKCGREVFRSREGLCLRCWEDMKDKELEIRDEGGILNLLPQSVIMSIVHPSRRKD